VVSRVEAARDEIVELCRSLVRVPSSVEDRETRGGEAEVARLVAGFLERHGIQAELFESHPGVENLVATLEGERRGGRLLFNGHSDVVPPGDPSDWEVDPFSAELREGRIYGRGSCDMKGGVAAMAVAVCVLRDLEVPLRGSVILNVVGDEERMGELGTGWCIRHLWDKIRADAGIVGEPSGAGALGRIVGVGEKGPVWLKVTVRGRKAHGSMPMLGDNAIAKMMRLLQALLDRGPPQVKPPLTRDELIGLIAEGMGVEPEALKPLLGGGGGGPPNPAEATLEALTTTTMNLGIMRGGVAANVVPDRCEAQLDFRVLPGQRAKDLVGLVEGLARELGLAGDVEVEILNGSEGSFVENFREDRLAITLLETARQLAGPTAFFMFPAATDARLLRDAGIPSTLVYGPGDATLAHTVNEYVSIDDLVAAAKVYAVTAVRFLGLH